ncbi:MAG: hypothetical protein WAT32_09485, partial [Candidatus Microthrix parvicella]
QLSASGAVNEHGLVFTRTDGKPLHPHTVSQAFERAQRRLDVSPIRFHDYADLRVMPTSGCDPLRGEGSGVLMSA